MAVVSYGRDYDGRRVSDRPWREVLIAPDRFPQWQGPDGVIYVLTEEEDGALLTIEPVE